MEFYQAGYYLKKINEANYDSIANKEILTASNCINDCFLDSWSFDWAVDGKDKSKISSDFNLDETQITQLHKWVERNFEDGEIGWSNIFYSINKIKEYKQEFFPSRNDLTIIGIAFSQVERLELIEEFKPKKEGLGKLGIWQGLKLNKQENKDGKLIGYDLIGVELDCTFHTFHCHEIATDLNERFGLNINSNGLIEECNNWKEVTDYCNDESVGLEPVPWYYCKVRLYD